MRTKDVDEHLSRYREYLARCKLIERELKELDEQIEALQKLALPDEVMRSPAQDGMPHGSGFGNPVESIGIAFADGYTPDHIKALISKREQLEREYAQKGVTVVLVGAWLEVLAKPERWVIENHVIDKIPWKHLAAMYRREFGQSTSKRQLQRISSKAIMKIYSLVV